MYYTPYSSHLLPNPIARGIVKDNNAFALPIDLAQKERLAKQQATIHKAVIQILVGKADKIPLLLNLNLMQYPTSIPLDLNRAYLNPLHPFTKLIEGYQTFDVKLFNEVFNNQHQHQPKNKLRPLSPYCQLLLQCDVFINIREALELATESNGLLSINLVALADIYWLLGALNIGSREPTFKLAISHYHHKTGYTDNVRDYGRYIRHLFNTLSRLLVIRLDLGYQQDFSVTYEQFREDVDYLLTIIPSNPVFKHLVGYI